MDHWEKKPNLAIIVAGLQDIENLSTGMEEMGRKLYDKLEALEELLDKAIADETGKKDPSKNLG